MDEFEKWLRTVCFQKPTPEAYDLAKCAWKQSANVCISAVEESQPPETTPWDCVDAIHKKLQMTIEHCMCSACKDGNLHDSDCAVHNMPAYPNGECDCRANAKVRGEE